MELEDKIANAIDSTAKAAGVELKPCGACKERQETLNRISRRGFVGGTTAALALVKNKALFAAWQGLGLQSMHRAAARSAPSQPAPH
jgi:hypothetical protein